MPKIARELAEKKEAFVLGLFATQPKITVAQIQDALKAQFNQTMSPATIAKLRKSLEPNNGLGSPIVITTETEAAPAPVAVAQAPQTTPSPGVADLEVNHSALSGTEEYKPLGEIVSPLYSAITDTDPMPPPKSGYREVEIRPGLVEIIKNA